jgi:hypothetical protein
MASIETGGIQRAGTASTPGATQVAPGAVGATRPLESRPAQPAATADDNALKSPDPMAVTDRYNLATPYTSSTLDL